MQPFWKDQHSRNGHDEQQNIQVRAKNGGKEPRAIRTRTQPPNDPFFPDCGQRDTCEQSNKNCGEFNDPVERQVVRLKHTLADREQNTTEHQSTRHAPREGRR